MMIKHGSTSHRILYISIFLICLAQGCSWDTTEYEKFALDGHVYTCKGICDTKSHIITQDLCLQIAATWDENNHYCNIDTPKQCQDLAEYFNDDDPIAWYNFSGTDLGNGRYLVRFSNVSATDPNASSNKDIYHCGSFDYVMDHSIITPQYNENYSTCSPEEVALYQELERFHICRNNTPYCIPMTTGKPSHTGPDNILTLTNTRTVAICSSCPRNQASCSTDGTSFNVSCFDLSSSTEHCGTCNNRCGENEMCKNGVCSERTCDDKNWCDTICIDPASRATCGITSCDEYKAQIHDKGHASVVACPKNADCVLTQAPNTYACRCAISETDKEEYYAKYYDDAKDEYICLNRTSKQFCGADTNSIGKTCGKNEKCEKKKDEDTYECVEQCAQSELYCPELVANCINPSTDVNYCGLGNCADASLPNQCNTEIGETCINGVCQCPNNQILCEVDGQKRCIDPKITASHCGASGNCTAQVKGNENYIGDDCASAGLTCDNGKCSCTKNDIFCDGKCVNPYTNTMYCGVDENCQPSVAPGESDKTSPNPLQPLYQGNCAMYNGIVSQSDASCQNRNCTCTGNGMVMAKVYRNSANETFAFQCVDKLSDSAYCEACIGKTEDNKCNGRDGCNDGLKCSNGECVETTLRCSKNEVACHDVERCYDKAIYHINATCGGCETGYCPASGNFLDGCFLTAESLHLSLDCQTCASGYCDTNNNLLDGCPLSQAMLHLNTTCDGCAEGWDDSDTTLLNGCDIDLNNNPLHCGTRDHNCYDAFYGKNAIQPANGDIACINGNCAVPVCSAHYIDCDNTPGCETDPRFDNNFCGNCQTQCKNGKACSNGKCVSCVQDDWGFENNDIPACCDGARYRCQTTTGFTFYACGKEAAGYACTRIDNDPSLTF